MSDFAQFSSSEGGSSKCSNLCTTKKLVAVGLGCVILAIVLGVAIGVPLSKRNAKTDREKAVEILEKYPLVDGHNDFPWQLYNNERNQLQNVDPFQDLRTIWGDVPKSGIPSQTDVPRLLKGKLGAQFWAAFVHCRTEGTDAIRLSIAQVDVVRRMCQKWPDTFKWVTTAQGIEDAFKEKKIGSLVGLEGGHSIDSDLATLRMFYHIGVRYMTLTHSCNTPWADNWLVDGNGNDTVVSNGLSDFGKDVVREMNRLGMLVDLSHVSKKTMQDALDVAEAPVIYSHSSAFSLCNSYRNVQDDVLLKTRDNGGVVMVNFYPAYITCERNATLVDVANHIDHIKNTAGVDHVGIGADYDGVKYMPSDLPDVSTYPDLFAELIKRGWTEEDLMKLAGKNLVRVFRKVEEYRDKKAADGMLPDETWIPEDQHFRNTCRTAYP